MSWNDNLFASCKQPVEKQRIYLHPSTAEGLAKIDEQFDGMQMNN